MDKPETFRSPADDRNYVQDTDPWNEFLSESSSDLAALQPSYGAADEAEPIASAVRREAPAPAPAVVPQEPPPLRFPSHSESVSLREVLNRQVSVQWAEAVAVVEQLCLALGDDQTGETRIPDLSDVLLTPDGDVVVRPGSSGSSDVATLGRALNAMLAASTTPLPLRLFVASSSATGRYGSIALYRDALSYYAPPGDRTELIRTLYDRAVDPVPVPVPTSTELPRNSVAPEPAPTAVAAKRAVPTWALTAAAGMLLGTLASVWVLRETSPPIAEARVDSVTPLTPPMPRVEPISRDDWELGGVSTPTGRSRVPAASTDLNGLRPSAPVLPPALESPEMREAAVIIPPLPTRSSSGPPPSAPSPRVLPPPASVVALAPVDNRVYSAADTNVKPPVMLSRNPTPVPLLSSTDSRVENTVELVIDAQGNVQTVRLTRRPTRLTDINILPPLKLLKFEPARKDGQAVSYQYILHVVDSPR